MADEQWPTLPTHKSTAERWRATMEQVSTIADDRIAALEAENVELRTEVERLRNYTTTTPPKAKGAGT